LATPEETDYVYDLVGNLAQVRLPNGVVSDYDYDRLNRLVKLTEFKDNNGDHLFEAGVDALLAQYDYDLAFDGKRSGVTELIDHDGNPSTPLQETRIDWLYDALGRLTEERYDSFDDSLDFVADYAFDLVGNRLSKKTDHQPCDFNNPVYDEAISYAYDANDRVLSEAKVDLTTANADTFTVYEYGANNAGTQQTKKTVHQGLDDTGDVVEATAYAYDVQGRMVQAHVDSDGDGDIDSTSRYEYDADGTRVSETVDGVETRFLVDKQNPTGYSQTLEEKDANLAIKKLGGSKR
jgi:YD repeat-containing protein